MSTSPRPGSRAIGGDGRRRKRGGLLWLLLALLAIIVLVVVLLASCGGSDSSSNSSATTSGAGSATAPADASSAPTAPSASAAPSTGGAQAATLTAGSTSLLSGEDFTSTEDQQATGTGLQVLSTAKGGFVVGAPGTDPTSPQAVFIEYGSTVGGDEAGSSYRATVGDTVDLSGPVKRAPSNPGRTLRLEQAEAALVQQQGAYVNATTVTKVG